MHLVICTIIPALISQQILFGFWKVSSNLLLLFLLQSISFLNKTYQSFW